MELSGHLEKIGTLRCLTVLACLFLANAQAAPVDRELFSLTDLSTVVRLSRPVLSPDGKKAALVISRRDPAENRVASTLILVDTKTGAETLLSRGEASNLEWSPSGVRLAWLAPDAEGTSQIMMLSLGRASNEIMQVTSALKTAGVRAFEWSPNEESFAYLAPDVPAALIGDARFDRTFEVSDADYLGTTYLARTSGDKPARLWVTPVQAGKARLVAADSGYIQDLTWRPDGRAVTISSNAGSSEVSARFGTLRSVDIENGKETMIVADHGNVSAESRISISSHGALAYQHYRGQDPWLYGNQVAVIVDGRSRDVTAALDRDVEGYGWLASGNDLLVSAPDHLQKGVWSVSLSGAPHRLNLGAVNPDSPAASSRSGVVAFVGSEPNLPPELYVMATVNSMPVRMTSFNDLTHRRFGAAKAVTWRNDGLQHDGVLTYPPDFTAGRKYPMLVSIHGGPHTSSQLSFNGESQYYAANGWLVFEPNYRGSDGQGDGYQTAVIGDATAGPGRDIAAGVAAIKAQGIVDEARVAVTGWSYGGVMTSWMIGHQHDWCAAIPGVLVVDFAGYYDQSDTGIWIGSLLGSPHLPENKRKYVEQSPATFLDQVTTPTLMMQNSGDDNAPVAQAYQLYHALKDRGVKAKFVIFGIDGHGPGDPFHEREAVVRTLSWMNENCKASAP